MKLNNNRDHAPFKSQNPVACYQQGLFTLIRIRNICFSDDINIKTRNKEKCFRQSSKKSSVVSSIGNTSIQVQYSAGSHAD